MKLNGVRRARLADGTELEFARDVIFGPAVTTPTKTADDVAREAHERRRKRLEKELGRPVSDELMKALP